MINYYEKYLKYKNKYLNIKLQVGGSRNKTANKPVNKPANKPVNKPANKPAQDSISKTAQAPISDSEVITINSIPLDQDCDISNISEDMIKEYKTIKLTIKNMLKLFLISYDIKSQTKNFTEINTNYEFNNDSLDTVIKINVNLIINEYNHYPTQFLTLDKRILNEYTSLLNIFNIFVIYYNITLQFYRIIPDNGSIIPGVQLKKMICDIKKLEKLFNEILRIINTSLAWINAYAYTSNKKKTTNLQMIYLKNILLIFKYILTSNTDIIIESDFSASQVPNLTKVSSFFTI
jgi:hypothetical protein